MPIDPGTCGSATGSIPEVCSASLWNFSAVAAAHVGVAAATGRLAVRELGIASAWTYPAPTASPRGTCRRSGVWLGLGIGGGTLPADRVIEGGAEVESAIAVAEGSRAASFC